MASVSPGNGDETVSGLFEDDDDDDDERTTDDRRCRDRPAGSL